VLLPQFITGANGAHRNELPEFSEYTFRRRKTAQQLIGWLE
jgi:hypothetical protein